MLARYPTARRWVYAALGVTSLGIGATSAYLAAVGVEPPPVMLGVAAVWSFLAAATGYLAVSNTSTHPRDVSKSGPDFDTSDVISMHSYEASPDPAEPIINSGSMSASSRHPTELPTDSPPGEPGVGHDGIEDIPRRAAPSEAHPDGYTVETGADGMRYRDDDPKRRAGGTE